MAFKYIIILALVLLVVLIPPYIVTRLCNYCDGLLKIILCILIFGHLHIRGVNYLNCI